MAATTLTPKQEAFAVAVLSGASNYDAYVQAYPRAAEWRHSNVDAQAGRMLRHPLIIPRLAELRDRAAQATLWSISRIIKELAETAVEAREAGDRASAVRAYELIGRHIGMWPRVAPNINIDARQQSLTIEGAGLSPEQLRKVAFQMIEGEE